MPDPTLGELAARVAAIEAKLGMSPKPALQLPPAPTGFRITILADGSPRLDWDAPDPVYAVTSTDIIDALNMDKPVQATVTGTSAVRSPVKPGTRRRYVLRHRNAAGISLLSAAVDVPAVTPVPDPPPTSAKYPIDLFGKNWYLTTPIPRVDGLATEIHQPDLATYTSKYFELTPDGKAAVFRAWHGGATTKGSKNTRSELREEIQDGAAHAAWSSNSGRHRLVVHGRVNRLTKVRPHCVIAQIHDAADDVTVFRVEGTNLWITAGDNPHGYLLDGNFALGRDYEIGFDVSNGVISYLYSGRVVPYTLSAKTEGNYFKAGCYCQSNPTNAPSESTDEYAEVVIYSATVTHS